MENNNSFRSNNKRFFAVSKKTKKTRMVLKYFFFFILGFIIKGFLDTSYQLKCFLLNSQQLLESEIAATSPSASFFPSSSTGKTSTQGLNNVNLSPLSSSFFSNNNNNDIETNDNNNDDRTISNNISCSSLTNSKEWLQSRFKNIHDRKSIFLPANNNNDNFFQNILKQSLCYTKSKFLNPQLTVDDYYQSIHLSTRSSTSRDSDIDKHKFAAAELDYNEKWLFRLIYFGIYLHQYEPALEEIIMTQKEKQKLCSNITTTASPTTAAEEELHNNNDDDDINGLLKSSSSLSLLDNAIKNDYECKNTKYLISNIPMFGVGADIRLSVVPTLLTGIALNRTVIFINGLKEIKSKSIKYLSQDWTLSGCGGRRTDYQCFFLPISPCVPSTYDMEHNSIILPNTTYTYQLQQTGSVNLEYNNSNESDINNAKIIIMPSQAKLPPMDYIMKEQIGKRLQELIRNQINSNYDLKNQIPMEFVEQLSDPQKLQLLGRDETANRPYQLGMKYDQSNEILNAAALLYIMRLNTNFDNKVNSVLYNAIPDDFLSSNDNPTTTNFGMPIRASDKCGMESTCLSFEKYMELIQQQRKAFYGINDNRTIMDIILTSESSDIMSKKSLYENGNKNNITNFPYRFIINQNDIQQGGGWPGEYGLQEQRYDIMVSTVVALKLQLLSKHFVANCCSRFFEVLMDLIKNGCGYNEYPSIHCMQELEDEQFHLCCSWSQSKKCRKQLHDFRKKENHQKQL